MEFKLFPLFLVLVMSYLTGCYALDNRDQVVCSPNSSVLEESDCAKAPTDKTKILNAELYGTLPFDQGYDSSSQDPAVQAYEEDILDANGQVVWSRKEFSYLDNMEINGVDNLMINPSLLRQAQLNNRGGLFEVDTSGSGRVFQVRGLDLSVMTLIESENGWIVIDPLTAKETAQKGLELLEAEIGQKPNITAVIFTHSHIDHFGGVFGVIEENNPTNVDIYAPVGFFEHAISENVLAGNIMSRRAAYMYGNVLDQVTADNAGYGKVDGGLGKTTPTGLSGIIAPQDDNEISVDTPDNNSIPIDGQPVYFIMANDSEAPSEFMIYFENHKMLMAAEVATKTIHNISSLRGARTRDSKAWTTYLDTVLNRFGSDVELMIASHHWPTVGNTEVVEQLQKTRDSYKYVHDQVLRLANKGLTPNEISEEVVLPDSLGQKWYNRGYYGSVSHNARATYDFYLGGWWDGNPVNLDPLSPEKEGEMYVEAFTAKGLVDAAKVQIANDNYRGAVRMLNHVIFAGGSSFESERNRARLLSANALEQLGYQAESGPWRNYYLGAVRELREGQPPTVAAVDTTGISGNLDSFAALDSLAIRVNPDDAENKVFTVRYTIQEKGTEVKLFQLLSNSVLKTYDLEHQGLATAPGAIEIDVHASRSYVLALIDEIATEGNCDTVSDSGFGNISSSQSLKEFCRVFDQFETEFGIAMP